MDIEIDTNKIIRGSVHTDKDKAANQMQSSTIPRSGADLLTAKQQELLHQIAEAGSLEHAKMRTPTAGVLLGKWYITPSNNGTSYSLTKEGEAICREIIRKRQITETI